MPSPAGTDGPITWVGDVAANVANASVEDAFTEEVLPKEVLDAPKTAGCHGAFLRSRGNGGSL